MEAISLTQALATLTVRLSSVQQLLAHATALDQFPVSQQLLLQEVLERMETLFL